MKNMLALRIKTLKGRESRLARSTKMTKETKNRPLWRIGTRRKTMVDEQ
jgi:hypothetical protein